MPIKIDSNQSAMAFHINDGPVTFPYAIDAHSAVSRFPLEWSADPWTADATAAARQEMEARHAQEVENAKARGLPVPKDLAPLPPEPTPEEQAAIMEHAQAVAEANERLKVAREKAAKARAEAEQIAADEALVASPPPQPDPNARRPRAPSPAQIRKAAATLSPEEQAAKDASDKAVKDKADADALAGNAPAHVG